MGTTLLVFILLYWNALPAEQYDIGIRRITVKNVAQCNDKKNLDVAIENIVIGQENGMQTVSGKLIVRKDIGNKFFIKINVWRCDASERPDSCEYVVKNYKAANMCEVIGMRNEIWTVFADNIDVAKECPIKMGNYTLKKTIITRDVIETVPFANAIWKLRYTGFDHSKNILCLDLEVAVQLINAKKITGRRT